jgi:hypothetical protein
MATIRRRRNGDGSTSWDAMVRIVGYPASGKSFRTKLAAVSGGLSATGSPGESAIVLFDPAQVLLADQEEMQIEIAKHASLQMLSDPATGATSTVSLWQSNLQALRCERWLSWQRATTTSAAVLDNVTF